MNSELKAFTFGVVGVTLVLSAILVTVYGAETGRVVQALAVRTPLLLSGSPDFSRFEGGFAANIIISLWAMLIAGITGVALGIGLIAQSAAVRTPSVLVMNILRNSPWLVVLYAMLYLLPFEVDLFGTTFFLSPLVKSVIGLALPVTANIAEVFRGGVEAIPSGQWESARSLGYRRLQILRHVVVPQAIPFMTPNLMTTYAMLFIGTSLVVVTGAADVLSVARTVIASDGAHYATAIYLYVLFLFFIFCFPIAILTRWLERRVRVRQ
ncbi:amino acid ABC transporter permease [Bosea lathyri]|jgi:polar amino acid transport system permease protein|uniref:Amino acid ABC transporter membrane protein 2, PAAT family (TC 3.A.1.3.-) n=1 Tax=Bosea lathyri TaxID=1036778 RepID=A0A1H5YV54_9HYPH|nr:amino acid ABC transporter permease [Bosea lathyri]SEG27680.1 amino acid ABC transporter membrane protein 2, PAAT family (TC 3.A.1.3.-) [Bosea lathyri]